MKFVEYLKNKPFYESESSINLSKVSVVVKYVTITSKNVEIKDIYFFVLPKFI
jgi:hypothetical protein